MAKEIHFNTESRENLRKGVDILANAVKVCLLYTSPRPRD